MTFKDYCAKHGIEIELVHLGVKKDNAFGDDKEWLHDAYQVTLRAEGIPGELVTDWKQGIGHRTWRASGASRARTHRGNTVFHAPKAGDRLNDPTVDAGGKRWELPEALTHPLWERWTEPTAPTVEEVLGSVSLDCSNADESFEEWCADYGYDEDSRRAEKIYRACQEQARKARKWLGAERFNALLECTED